MEVIRCCESSRTEDCGCAGRDLLAVAGYRQGCHGRIADERRDLGYPRLHRKARRESNALAGPPPKLRLVAGHEVASSPDEKNRHLRARIGIQTAGRPVS